MKKKTSIKILESTTPKNMNKSCSLYPKSKGFIKIYWSDLNELEVIYGINNGIINITVSEDDDTISDEN